MSRLRQIASEQRQSREAAKANGICWYCAGQGVVFPGVKGYPHLLDYERVVDCPRCGGTGKPPAEQGELFAC